MAITDQHQMEHLDYLERGARHAAELANRGPIRFDDDGALAADIAEAYHRLGFYVFTDAVGAVELAELRADVDNLLDRAPHPTRHSTLDRMGRPVPGLDFPSSPWSMAPPLSDPVGGTAANDGRHPVKMDEPAAPEAGPVEVPYMVSGALALSLTFLRLYGHPELLRVAESVNGPDFTPFTEVLFVKEPGLGPSVAWHQDGRTHWDNPDWDEGIHGFNFQVQLYGSTAANAVWVVPGSHREGRIDIEAKVAANGGSDRLPDAVPIISRPGDCVMTNRQTLHCSFPNLSDERRITANFGFHRRSSVLGQDGVLSGAGHVYDEDYILERSRCIPVAVDARAQRFPHEERFVYRPLSAMPEANRYTAETRVSVIHAALSRQLAI